MNLNTLRKRYKDKILEIATECKAENVRVFGSIVRNEAKSGSDIDLLVHFKPGADLFDIGGLQWKLEELLKRKVDIMPDDSMMHPLVRKNAFKDAVPL